MQGAGNDYIYLNGFEEEIANPGVLAKEMSDRHFGIGSDGIVLILPSESCDFGMRMFNSDGSEAEMCGNASRCVGKYVYERGLTKKKKIMLETKAGTKILTLRIKNKKVESVCVDMGEPVLSPEKIPVKKTGASVIGQPFSIGNEIFNITCVSMGNPHVIIFMDDFSNRDLHTLGKQIECHPLFPECTNVEFVKVDSPESLYMRVWERGSGETYACGTGACASLVAAVLNGFSHRNAVLHLLGGDLEIEWKEFDNHVYMTGGAELVFEGEWPYKG